MKEFIDILFVVTVTFIAFGMGFDRGQQSIIARDKLEMHESEMKWKAGK